MAAAMGSTVSDYMFWPRRSSVGFISCRSLFMNAR